MMKREKMVVLEFARGGPYSPNNPHYVDPLPPKKKLQRKKEKLMLNCLILINFLDLKNKLSKYLNLSFISRKKKSF